LVTLEQAFQTNVHVSMPGMATETLWVATAYFGAHLPLEERTFGEMLIGCDHLVDWMNLSGHFRETLPDGGPRWRLSYTFPPEMTVELPDGTVVEATVTNSFSLELGTATSKENWVFEIRPTEPALVHQLWAVHGARLRDLLTFATGVPNRVQSITVHSSAHQSPLPNGRPRYVDIDVLYRVVQPAPTLVDAELIHPLFQLFTRDAFPGDFAAAVRGWFAAYERAPEAIDLLMGLRYQPAFYWPYPLVYTVQAIESYHRETMESDRTAAKRRIVEILESTPEEHRAWLEGRLKHAYEPSLQDRLFEVIKRVRPVIAPLVDDSQPFVEGAMAARNARSHPGDRTRDRSPQKDLDWVKLKTQAESILMACLVLDMGLNAPTARALLTSHQPWARAVRMLSESTILPSEPAPDSPPAAEPPT
jgi:hypothetical protein